MSTTAIPTDNYGNVYYGPKTVKAAEAQIMEGRPAREMVKMLRDAGCDRVANKIAQEWGVGYSYSTDATSGEVVAPSLRAAFAKMKKELGITQAMIDDGAFLWVRDDITGEKIEIGESF